MRVTYWCAPNITTMEIYTKLQYYLSNNSKPYIGTVIDTTPTEITVEPVADATGTPLTTPATHNLSRETDSYRVIATP